jgi:protein-S-isoprenylcysteine O-methyltransferase Ste14
VSRDSQRNGSVENRGSRRSYIAHGGNGSEIPFFAACDGPIACLSAQASPSPLPENTVMKRWIILLYGFTTYLAFLATFLYAIGFVGNLFVPRSIDALPQVPFATAIGIDILLLGIFGLQHSLMARPWFKRRLARWFPESAERTTYTLMSSLTLILLFWAWQPLGGDVWRIEHPLAVVILHMACAFGWLLVLGSTFLLNHFDMFGLRQVWLQFKGTAYQPIEFRTPGPYKIVRHPLYVGWLFAFWATPSMTATHLLFASVCTMYILVAIQLEERDLLAALPDYAGYKERVPMLVPGLSGKGRVNK